MSNPIMAHEECWSALQLAALGSAMAGRSVFECNGKKWTVGGIVGRDVQFNEIRLAAMPEPAPWRGSGLPPVGTICKLAGPSHGFMPINPEWAGAAVKIYAHFTTDNGTRLAAYVDEKHLKGGVGIDKLFLPIRTPEQIAAELREKEIQEMMRSMPDAYIDEKLIAETLYSAGYRKQEQPK